MFGKKFFNITYFQIVKQLTKNFDFYLNILNFNFTLNPQINYNMENMEWDPVQNMLIEPQNNEHLQILQHLNNEIDDQFHLKKNTMNI